jgi:THO complex subunit 5
MALPTKDAEIVTDPFLLSALEASTATLVQCLKLLDLTIADGARSDEISMEKQAELSKQRKLLLAQLARLRGMSRNAVLLVRQTKQDTAGARSEIDTLHLQLQNLYYEQRHLRGEIAACESYK